MSITLEVDGVPFDTENNNLIKSIEASCAMNRLSQAFNAVCSYDIFSNFPIKLGSPYRVLVNNIPIMTGNIEKVSAKYNANDKSVNISGRDKTASIIKSDINGTKPIKDNSTLVGVIQTILDNIGITNISIIDNVGVTPYAFGNKINDQDNAYDSISRFAREAQALVASNADGNLVIQRISEDPITTKLRAYIGDENGFNNILSGNIDFNTENLYKKYIAKGQDKVTLERLNPEVNKSAEFIDDYIDFSTSDRISLQMPILDENSQKIFTAENTTEISLKERAKWESSLRRAEAFKYSCVVQGFRHDGVHLWQPNTIVGIEDEFCDLFGNMLLREVVYRFDIESGSTTELQFVTRSSYSLKEKIESLDIRSNKTGNEITLQEALDFVGDI